MIHRYASAGELHPIDSRISGKSTNTSVLAALRRRLVRLALCEDDPSMIVERATQTVSRAFGCPCSFIIGDPLTEKASRCMNFAVHSDDCCIGTLLLGDRSGILDRFDGEEIQEIADLVGFCAVQAQQAQTIIELQNESEDMLLHAPDAIFVITLDGNVCMANRRALDFIGMRAQEVEGRPLGDVLGWAMPDAEELLRSVHRAEPFEAEINGPLGNRLVSLTLSHVGDEGEMNPILCVVRDITKERQAQLALRRSERFTLMDETVEYLIHEVNNPLAALLSGAAYAKKRCEEASLCLGQFEENVCDRENAGSNHTVEHLVETVEKMNKSLAGVCTSGGRIRDTMSALQSVRGNAKTTGPELVDVGFELGLAISAAMQEFQGRSPISREIGLLPNVLAMPLYPTAAF